MVAPDIERVRVALDTRGLRTMRIPDREVSTEMRRQATPRWLGYLALAPLLALTGCGKHFWLFHPAGPVADAELTYTILDFAIMLLVIVPALALVIWTVWRYRAAHGKGTYSPRWSHSRALELIVWGIPVLIVAALAYFSYVGTHAVNPWGPEVITDDPEYAQVEPLRIEVISTDWQWLFVYPDQHIAVSNELVVPVKRPVDFRLTSTSVTSNFFIPRVVGQIYAMPGMRTKQSMVVTEPGEYQGVSAELTGPGFSWMSYKLEAVTDQEFNDWVGKVRDEGMPLAYPQFAKFAEPTVNIGQKVELFKDVPANLFVQVIENVRAGKLIFPTPSELTENMRSPKFLKHEN
jgi:cytochrome o ubiquinol oxidase subunit II